MPSAVRRRQQKGSKRREGEDFLECLCLHSLSGRFTQAKNTIERHLQQRVHIQTVAKIENLVQRPGVHTHLLLWPRPAVLADVTE